MKVKKIGHCCLLINIDGVNIITDPGIFTHEQNSLENIDIILITHEHEDHFHIVSLIEILKNNQEVEVVTNSAVGKILDNENISRTILENGESREVKGVLIESFDCKHEEIFEEVGQVQNTGYFIGNKLFYPGDSFCNPNRPVDILALPVAGPWCRVADSIRYALQIDPRIAFPVHDGALQEDKIGGSHKIPKKVLTENGIEFLLMNPNDVIEF